MKLYPEEWKAFISFQENESNHFPEITNQQKKTLLERAHVLKGWQKKNIRLHNIITASVLIFNLSMLAFLGLVLPTLVQISFLQQAFISLLYGLIAYGLSVYSLHELNGHNQGFIGNSKFIKLLDFFAKNACRISHADPVFYKTQHYSHHTYTGTEEDKAFTNAISFKRFLISIIPFAVATPFCDYKIHTSDEWSKSKAISEILSTILLLAITINLYFTQRWGHALIFVTVAPWSSFFFDRLRETSEHNFMPNSKGSEARSFGLSFWGLVVGGGPWGQCCHLMHHISPSLPWYLQITLQRDFEKMLTSKQKSVYLSGGFFNYILLWRDIIKKQHRYFH